MGEANDRLETLLELLTRGDQQAAEEIFRAYEPYLRMVVRRKLSAAQRAKFDSMDIVQSVWADLLVGFRDAEWRFQDAAHLRRFLTSATRNRFIDRIRRTRTAVRREEPLPEETGEGQPESSLPGPGELAQANDLWERMLSESPPAHHELLRLRRQGAPLAEVAARTGLHEGSVRRILYGLAHRLGLKPASRPPLAAGGARR